MTRLAGIDAKGRDWVHIGLLFALGVLVVFLVFSAGWWMARQSPVCHSQTEDSVITDCDYRSDGGWYMK